MENKNRYIREPKIAEQIDPLLARDYKKLAADKARSLINRPDHVISISPMQDLVPKSNPDANQVRNRSDSGTYKNSYTNGFVKMSGTTEEFIGVGDGAIIQSSDYEEIKKLEKKAIEGAESKDFINGLPEGKLVEPIDLDVLRLQLRFRKNDNNSNNTDGPEAA